MEDASGGAGLGLSDPGPGSLSDPSAFGFLVKLPYLFGFRGHGGSREGARVCGNPQT